MADQMRIWFNDTFFKSFFSFFGFTDNPCEEKAKKVLEKSPAEKIKDDLKRVNSDYRKKYLELRKQAVCFEQ